MKLYYSPGYARTLYLKGEPESPVLMGQMAVSTKGLLQELELRLGRHTAEEPGPKRLARYYREVEKWMELHLTSPYWDSFEKARLTVAQKLLSWRDELRMAGCDLKSEGEGCGPRLQMLAEIEKLLEPEPLDDIPARIERLMGDIKKLGPDHYEGLTICLPCEKGLFLPLEKKLLSAVEGHGATLEVLPVAEDRGDNLSKIRNWLWDSIWKDKDSYTDEEGKVAKITLDPGDDSLQVWRFEDEFAAAKYLAHLPATEADVWIDPDGKLLDDYLTLLGAPRSGSDVAHCSPRLLQLFATGVSIFFPPLNIQALIDYLDMPVHPLPVDFRRKLRKEIISTGGFYNSKCREIIDNAVSDGKVTSKLVETFLPSLAQVQEVETHRMEAFLKELKDWGIKRGKILEEKQPAYSQQLFTVAGMAEELLMLMKDYKEEKLTREVMQSWIDTLFNMGTYLNVQAEQGCRRVLDSPDKMVSIAPRVIWVCTHELQPRQQECEFLLPSERKAVTRSVNFQDTEKRRRYDAIRQMLPFLRTSGQLILVETERLEGERAAKHPLILRLERQVENYENLLLKTKNFTEEETEEIPSIDNTSELSELHFEHGERLRWPDHFSPTSLDNLVVYPLDFLMERLLGIKESSDTKLAKLSNAKGTFAHAVIQHLLEPKEKGTKVGAPAVRLAIDTEFERVWAEQLDACGAQLQLPENALEKDILHSQLQDCLKKLCEIMEANSLSVSACEKEVIVPLEIDGHTVQMKGCIDTVLEDADGIPVVFDFKWTKEKSKSHYANMVKENRSIQLSLYRSMLTAHSGRQVERVGYYQMPLGRLHTSDPFMGPNINDIEPDNRMDITPLLLHSIIFRKGQFASGVLELGGPLEQLEYQRQTPVEGLFPLKKDEYLTKEKKDGKEYRQMNNYSNFKNFLK